jgi:hypothetical protein
MTYTHVSGTALHYYQMLANATGYGQCTAWAELLVQVLAIQGIGAHTSNMRANVSGNPLDDGFRVKLMPAQGSGGADYTTTDFGFHQVVRVDGFANSIFDPSYGTRVDRGTDTRTVEQIYEDLNVTAVFNSLLGTWQPDVPSDGIYWLFFTP